MTHRPLFLTIRVALGLLFVCSLWRPIVPLGAAEPCEQTRLVDPAAASEILATQRPFAPTDRNLFYSYRRADWGDVAPLQYAKGPGLTEQETKERLRVFLQRRFPCSPRRVQDGLSVFANPIARQKIPDPTLRASLAALTGTIGEPAIDYVLFQAPVTTIHFGIVIQYGEGLPTAGSATAYPAPDGTDEIVIDGNYRFSPFGTFSALLFHEALHVEPPATTKSAGAKPIGAGVAEETTAVALESLVYMQMLLTDPTLATLPDSLTRVWSNGLVLARINSGVAGTDRLNLYVPDGQANIDPIAVEPVTEFSAYYPHALFGGPGDPAWRKRESRGTPLLAAVLRSLAEPGHAPPAKPDFDRATLDFIDQNQAVLSPGQLVAVACILKLDVPCS